jgi:hypothetical protein
MLLLRKSDEPLTIAMDHCVGGDHLGIEQRALRQLTVEDAAMPIRPIHHGSDAKSVIWFSHIADARAPVSGRLSCISNKTRRALLSSTPLRAATRKRRYCHPCKYIGRQSNQSNAWIELAEDMQTAEACRSISVNDREVWATHEKPASSRTF